MLGKLAHTASIERVTKYLSQHAPTIFSYCHASSNFKHISKEQLKQPPNLPPKP